MSKSPSRPSPISLLGPYLATFNGWLLLALLFIAPIFFDRRLAIVFSGSKIGLVRIITLTIILIAGVSLLLGNRPRQKWGGLHWRGAAYFIAITISTILSIHPWVSFIGAHGRYEGWLTLFNYALLFLFAIEYLPGPVWRDRLIGVVFLSGIVESVYGIIQRHGLDPYQWGGVNTVERIIGTIGQPNFVAAHIAMSFLLALSLLFGKPSSPVPIKFIEKSMAPLAAAAGAILLFLIMIYSPSFDSLTGFPLWLIGSIGLTILAIVFAATFDALPSRWRTGLLFTGLTMMGVAILYTQSRGGVMGWLGGIALFAIFFPRGEWAIQWKKAVSMGAIIVILLAALVLVSDRSPLRRMAEETTVSESSNGVGFKGAVGSRFETWKSCLRLAGQYPFFGIGPETIKMLFPQVEMPLFRFYEGFHIKQDRAHNEVLDTVVTKGNIGLLLYVILIAGVFHRGYKRWQAGDTGEKTWVGALLGMLASYLIQNQFSFGVVAITTLFWVGFGLIAQEPDTPVSDVSLRTFPGREFAHQISGLSFPRLLGGTTLVILTGVLMAMAVIPYRADIHYKRSKIFYDQNDGDGAEREIQQAVALTPREATYVLHAGVVAFRAAGIPSRDPQLSEEAIRRFESGTRIDPHAADSYFFIGRTALGLILAGHSVEKWNLVAVQRSRQALEIDPYFSEAWETLGYIEERDGKLTAALDSFVKAFKTMPVEKRYVGKIIELAQKTGRAPAVIASLENLEKEVPTSAQVLLMKLKAELYRMNGNPAAARTVYDKLLRDHPHDVEVLQGAAMLDLQTGHTAAAHEKLQRALISDPQNAETQRLLNLIRR